MLTQIINAVVFGVLAVLSLVVWWRRRDAATGWLAGAWSCLWVGMAVGLLLPETGSASLTGGSAWLVKLGIGLPTILHPYCLLRFAASFDRSRLLPRVGAVLTALVVLGMLAFPYWPGDASWTWWVVAWVVGFVVQWVGLSTIAAVRLWRAGRTEPAVTRRRMQLLAVAALGLSAAVLLSLLASTSPVLVRTISTALVFAAAGCGLVGLTPPASVRMVWRRGEHRRIYELQLSLIRAERRGQIPPLVLPVLTELLGGGAAVLADPQGRVVGTQGPPEDVAELTAVVTGAASTLVPGVVRMGLRSGELVVRAGPYAPLLGDDELRLFESVSLMVDSAVGRIEGREQLAAAHERALEASRLKSEFLANMSHEIRTPINGVIGIAELLSRTALDAEQRDYLTTIQTSTEALLNVLNDVLDFSKIEAGKLDLHTADFDLRDAVEEVAALFAGSAHRKGIELAVDVEQDVPHAVHGDVGRLRQVLLNLAGNAVKFTDVGEVVIRVSRAAGGSGAPQRDGTVRCRFDVTDTGPGVAAEAVGSLFESFSQADSSSTRRYGGTGLGLAISKRLVELLGGEIGVSTEAGRGSVFWFELDLPPAAPLASASSTELCGRSVLVVDDNATNRTILLHTAERWQLDAVEAADVETALAALERRHAEGRPFDLAWIDHQMPGRDGAELARTMAGDQRFAGTLRILLTSTGERPRLDAGDVQAFLTKPVRPSVLQECAVRLLRAAAAPTGAGEVPAAAGHGVGAAAERVDVPPVPGRRVLVAEDNEVSQHVARRMLELLGCAVDVADNGVAALAAARRQRYDLIVMDCQMPEMDGYEATAALRAAEAPGIRTPVVALTANAMVGDAERCRAAGMDDFLTKPVRLEELSATLDRWLPPTAAPAPDAPPAPDATAGQPSPGLRTGPPVDPVALSALTGAGGTGALVELFLRTTSEQLAGLRVAVRQDDAEEVRRLCHAVRGAARYLGAEDLAAGCQALETGAESDRAGRLDQLRTIEQEFARVQDFLSAGEVVAPPPVTAGKNRSPNPDPDPDAGTGTETGTGPEAMAEDARPGRQQDRSSAVSRSGV